jgi:toxin YhaV
VTPPENGWRIFIHQLLDHQLDALNVKIYRAFMKSGANSKPPRVLKLSRRLKTLMHSDIPQNPSSALYRLGSTLGDAEKVWFRAKMFGQYRLFFRFDSASKIIVYVWVNDEESLRAYGSKTDAYALFAKMLSSGNPPSTFEELLKQSREI